MNDPIEHPSFLDAEPLHSGFIDPLEGQHVANAARRLEEQMRSLTLRHRQLLRADHDMQGMTTYFWILKSRLEALERELHERMLLRSRIHDQFQEERMEMRESVERLRSAAASCCKRHGAFQEARDAMTRVDSILERFVMHFSGEAKNYPFSGVDLDVLESEIAYLLLSIGAPGVASSEVNGAEELTIERSIRPSQNQSSVDSRDRKLDRFEEALGLKVQTSFLTRCDFPDVLDVEKSAFLQPWTEDELLIALRGRNRIGMIAHTDWRMTGFMIYQLQKQRLDLINFAVHADLQRHGVGTAMMKRLKQKLTDQRRTHIATLVRESNIRAFRFFSQHEFCTTQILRGHFQDTGEDAWELTYALPGNPKNPPAAPQNGQDADVDR